PLTIGITMYMYYNVLQQLMLFSIFSNVFLPILFAAVVSIIGQYSLLLFLEQSLYVFVGLGLLLRAFTLTRRMGSTIIAIFLGGFIFFKLALAIETPIILEMNKYSPTDKMFNIPLGLIDPMAGGKLAIATIVGVTSKYLLEGLYYPTMSMTCFYISNAICAGTGPGYPLCMAITQGFCWTVLFPFLIFPLMIASIYVGMIGTVIGMLAQIFLAFGGALVPTLMAHMIADEIATQIAANSDLMAFAFFIPVFNIIFVLAGVKALVEAMGGDETVVHMLTFI
ncbi:MAG: hypothetical protein QXU54_00950, partial [Candidatus Micrarchaeia archaeon]